MRWGVPGGCDPKGLNSLNRARALHSLQHKNFSTVLCTSQIVARPPWVRARRNAYRLGTLYVHAQQTILGAVLKPRRAAPSVGSARPLRGSMVQSSKAFAVRGLCTASQPFQIELVVTVVGKASAVEADPPLGLVTPLLCDALEHLLEVRVGNGLLDLTILRHHQAHFLEPPCLRAAEGSAADGQ